MNQLAFFVSDLHGSISRFNSLFKLIKEDLPSVVFITGDILPSGMFAYTSNNLVASEFIENILKKGFLDLKKELGPSYPEVFLILGNDDGRSDEVTFVNAQRLRIWNYIHGRKVRFNNIDVYGYSYIPPSPFMLKDWERYDVSRYVDPGCVPPEEGVFSKYVDKKKLLYKTIKKDIDNLVGSNELNNAIFLFHSPPYDTFLDRAALDGKTFEHVPLDVHIGSIAVKEFIKERQPMLTLHGHVHESTSLTGIYKQKIGDTLAINAAHNGPELSLIRFNLYAPEGAWRTLI